MRRLVAAFVLGVVVVFGFCEAEMQQSTDLLPGS
jgi:hypothetical protein